jgi:hypothetical protein
LKKEKRIWSSKEETILEEEEEVMDPQDFSP